jgi:hypothetical protein
MVRKFTPSLFFMLYVKRVNTVDYFNLVAFLSEKV